MSNTSKYGVYTRYENVSYTCTCLHAPNNVQHRFQGYKFFKKYFAMEISFYDYNITPHLMKSEINSPFYSLAYRTLYIFL